MEKNFPKIITVIFIFQNSQSIFLALIYSSFKKNSPLFLSFLKWKVRIKKLEHKKSNEKPIQCGNNLSKIFECIAVHQRLFAFDGYYIAICSAVGEFFQIIAQNSIHSRYFAVPARTKNSN